MPTASKEIYYIHEKWDWVDHHDEGVVISGRCVACGKGRGKKAYAVYQ
jgi:hypothetical protein